MPEQGRLGDKSKADTDAHGCPACPHSVVGPAVKGSPDILVNSRPALRVSDAGIHAACCGPNIWSAVQGSPTVLFNSLPAHRKGDQDAHCGGIGDLIEGSMDVMVGETGGPTTTLQADGSYLTTYNKTISIEGSLEYQATVIQDLHQLFAKKDDGSATTGSKLADSLSQNGHSIVITPIPANKNQGNAYARAANGDAYATKDSKGKTVSGKGCDSTVFYNPSLTMSYTAEDGTPQTMPSHEILGHELIHADHNARGNNMRNFPDSKDPNDNLEEAQTIGVHGYENENISERGFHKEEGRSPRPNHDAVNGMTYRGADGKWYSEQEDANGNWTKNQTNPPKGKYTPNK